MKDLSKEQLLEQYDLLRTEYIKLLNDKDVLLQWGKPQLEALYNPYRLFANRKATIAA